MIVPRAGEYDPFATYQRLHSCIVCGVDFTTKRVHCQTCGPVCRKRLNRFEQKIGRRFQWGDVVTDTNGRPFRQLRPDAKKCD